MIYVWKMTMPDMESGGVVKLIFKQRMFSWFDNYDIYDEFGNIVYGVKGQMSWVHKLINKHRVEERYK